MTHSPHYFISSLIKRSDRQINLLNEQIFFHNASSTPSDNTTSSSDSSLYTTSTTSHVTPMISSAQGPLQRHDNHRRHFSQKLRELFLPHRPYDQVDHAFEHQQSLERCKSPHITDDNSLFQHLPSIASLSVSKQRSNTKDLYSFFVWIVQNIQPVYYIRRQQDQNKKKKRKSTTAKQLQNMTATMNELEKEAADTLIDTTLNSKRSNESPTQVLETRSCSSSFDMANLFVSMVNAAGIEDVYVVHGYLKAPKDTISLITDSSSGRIPNNHAWCLAKIENEYRVIDCWLASPYHPQNDNKIDLHWFLKPIHQTQLTHLTENDDTISFLKLPYVRHIYFKYPIHLLKCQTTLVDQNTEDDLFYVSFVSHTKSNVLFYAETESEHGVITRALTQCTHNNTIDNNTYTVKGVLPTTERFGWLKLYVMDNTSSLMMCFHLTQQQQQNSTTAFEFVHLNARYQHTYYIQEPQCYYLYPYQTYYFCVRSTTMGYHKLAIQSPSGRLVKLMLSNPQEHTYDGNVTIKELGTWSLLCIVDRTKKVLASWCCS